MTCNELHDRLAPYVDSELTPAEVSEFESHMHDCASCTADTLAQMRMKHMIRLSGLRYSPTPEFQLRLEKSIHAKQKPSWFAVPAPKIFAIAMAAMVLLTSVIVWMGRVKQERAFTELADLHVSTLASSNPVDVVSTDQHTVKPWFAGRLPFSFSIPELRNSDFLLIGGRVAYFQHSSGAQLLFGLRKHQLSVFIFKEQSVDAPFRFGTQASTELGLHLETWSEGGLRYIVVGDAPASDVHALSKLLKDAAHS